MWRARARARAGGCGVWGGWQAARASIGLYGTMSAAGLQKALLVCLERISGRYYAPPGSKRITLFVDDLHLPMQDAYGVQPPLELLRQLLDHGYLISSVDCLEMMIRQAHYLSVTRSSAAEAGNRRLLRHYAPLQVSSPLSCLVSLSTLMSRLPLQVSSPLLCGHLSQKTPSLAKASFTPLTESLHAHEVVKAHTRHSRYTRGSKHPNGRNKRKHHSGTHTL